MLELLNFTSKMADLMLVEDDVRGGKKEEEEGEDVLWRSWEQDGHQRDVLSLECSRDWSDQTSWGRDVYVCWVGILRSQVRQLSQTQAPTESRESACDGASPPLARPERCSLGQLESGMATAWAWTDP